MRIEREALINHLKRIYCDGQIGEVVLGADFSSRAITVDQTFLVIAPALEAATPLRHEVGIIDLGRFIGYLDSKSEDPKVSIDFDDEDRRILITEKRDKRVQQYSMVTAYPNVIGTAVRDDIFETIQDAVPALGHSDAVPLNASVVQDVLEAQSKVRSELMLLTVGPKGSELRLGEETADWARVELPLLKTEKGAEKFSLQLRSALVCDALKQAVDFAETFITVTGPDDMVAIDCSYYRYIISPEDME